MEQEPRKREWEVKLNRGGFNGPNYLIFRNGHEVGYLYNTSEFSTDFNDLLERVERGTHEAE